MRLIDADALKALIDEGWGEGPFKTAFFGEIDDATTIDPVKHGEWEPFDLTWGRSVYACSSCRDAMEVPTEMGRPIYDYCPNCGAKMDGGEE